MERELEWLRGERASDDAERHALAHTLGVPFVVLEGQEIAPEALLLVPEPLAREYNIVAYRVHEDFARKDLEVALLNLDDLERLDFLRARYRLLPRLTSRESLRKGLLRYQKALHELYAREFEKPESPRLLDALLRHALHAQASDIHLELTAKDLSVRYRIRGHLMDAMRLSPAAGKQVFEKLRSLAGLHKGLLPQHGGMRVDLGSGDDLLVRATSLPGVGAEKLVLHLVHERARRGYTLEGLGLHGKALEALHKTLLRRRGLVLVGGRLGGGKSTTLYTLLDVVNAGDASVATVEEKVEHALPRVLQTEVSGEVSAAAALRAAVRADSDVIMVGNLSDKESALVVVEAAARGTLVLCGVEAAGAREAVEAVRTFGISDERLERALSAAVGVATVQKLGGKQFAHPHKLARAESDALEGAGADFANVLAALKEEGKVEKETPWKDVQFYKPVPSSESSSGYEGVLGLQEVVIDAELVGLNLIEDGLYKAAQGLTTVEEVKKAFI